MKTTNTHKSVQLVLLFWTIIAVVTFIAVFTKYFQKQKKIPLKTNSSRKEKIVFSPPSVSRIKEMLYEESDRFLTDKDKENIGQLVKDFGLNAEQQKLVTLLYRYPYGYTGYWKEEDTGVSYKTYYSMLHNFRFNVPNTWYISPNIPEMINIYSPENVMEKNRAQLPDKEVFSVSVNNKCLAAETEFQTMVDNRMLTYRLAQRGVIKKSGPEPVKLSNTIKAQKYVLHGGIDSNFSKPPSLDTPEEKLFVIEEYYHDAGGVYYAFQMRYPKQGDSKYRNQAEEILASFVSEDISCTDNYRGLSQQTINSIYRFINTHTTPGYGP